MTQMDFLEAVSGFTVAHIHTHICTQLAIIQPAAYTQTHYYTLK